MIDHTHKSLYKVGAKFRKKRGRKKEKKKYCTELSEISAGNMGM